MLYYDREKPIDADNCPTFYIAGHCFLARKSMTKYHWAPSKDGRPMLLGNAKPAEKWKDFCDLIRYLGMAMPVWRDTKPYESNRKIIPMVAGARRYNTSRYGR